MTNRILVVFIGLAFLVAVFGGGPAACGSEPDVHETKLALENDCIVCHKAAYVAALSPRHEGSIPDTCDDCHSTELWSPLSKQADAKTIHALEIVTSNKVKCEGCHKDDYDATTKPKHEGMFPTDCADCHSTETYKPLPKDIHTTASFAKISAAADSCYTCHKEQYDNNPTHKGDQKPKNCAVAPGCHNVGSPTVKAWLPLKS
ncbi:MAG: hypothetical protein KIT84_32110 [Labilithrix sp.]|nr:hypothetical protein [Labilithrix sp.]MCW5815717.1 hypothetical protein [Labilithrix sp.]